ncbi:MAG: fumarylacetoacetate hydrolase family protein [Burkholderiales bacterium]
MQTQSMFAAATRLLDQRLSLTPTTDLGTDIRPQTETEAYALQRLLNGLLGVAGMGEQVGHKIGCTTPVMQAFLNIPNPCAGVIFSKSVLRGAGSIPRSGFVKLGIECEIAVQLRRNLEGGPFNRENVAEAVGAVMAAIEIVDDRYENYPTLGVPTLIADNFFNCGCVLGKLLADWRRLDLSRISGATFLNGVEVGRGTGALVMGHPFEALAWLANARAQHGLAPLKAGDFILLGSLVETKWLQAGDKVHIAVENLGEVSLSVT